LAQWLRETYHDDDKQPYFTEADLQALGEILLRLLRFRPQERPSANDILPEPGMVVGGGGGADAGGLTQLRN